MMTIFVKAHMDLALNKIAVVDTTREQSERYNDGLMIIKSEFDETYEVEATPTIADALKDKRLMKVDAPKLVVEKVKKE